MKEQTTKKTRGRPKGRTLRERTCLRCDHTWFPRSPEPPGTCPKCRSPYWARVKVRLTVKGRPKVTKKKVTKKKVPKKKVSRKPTRRKR